MILFRVLRSTGSCLALVLLLVVVITPDAAAQGQGGNTRSPLVIEYDPGGNLAAVKPGWNLRSPARELLLQVKAEVGKAVGVEVDHVAARGWAASAGLRTGDVLLVIAGRPVTVPGQVLSMLRAASGAVEVVLLRRERQDVWALKRVSLHDFPHPPADRPQAEVNPLAKPSAASVATNPLAQQTSSTQEQVTATPAAVVSSLRRCVDAYFDMLDFCRMQSWGRGSVTSPGTRQQALLLLKRSLPELPASAVGALRRLPSAWGELRTKWAGASQEIREQQRVHWRGRLLAPNPLLPVSARFVDFATQGGELSFKRPAAWTLARTRVDDTDFLFTGPDAARVNWSQVLAPAASPVGVLVSMGPVEEGLRRAKNLIAGCRFIASKYVRGMMPGLQEVGAFRIGPGAMVILMGGGATSRTFFWVGVMPVGGGRFLALRFKGKMQEAEAYLPLFSRMLCSMEVTQRDAEASAAVGLATSIIGNAVVSQGWVH